jgi:WD40 repeat protein
MESTDDQMLYVSFNQDASCFAVGTERGFKIYNSYPFKDNFERILDGGIGIVEMLHRCNIVALVGGGRNPKYAPNKVIIWDDHQVKVISELRFTSYVKSVKLKKDKIIVVCEQKIYVFNFISFQNIDTIDTFENPKGIVSVSSDPKITVLAYPDKTKGYVRVKSYDKSITALINAHESTIACLALNSDGTILASASDKGTLIRIFKADDGTFLQEVRRGAEKAEIYSIVFDAASKFIASSSDRGTIHIFTLATAQKKVKEQIKEEVPPEEEKVEMEETPKNQKSIWDKMTKIIPLPKYFKSEWSFAQFRIPDIKSICAFGPNNTVIGKIKLI